MPIPTRGLANSNGESSKSHLQGQFNRPTQPKQRQPLQPLQPCQSTLEKLKCFVYQPTTTKMVSSEQDAVQPLAVDNPGTPMPRRVPLSDLISSTPRTVETTQDVSPEDKVVWKFSPNNKSNGMPSSESRSSPSSKMTSFYNILKDEKKTPAHTPTVKLQKALRQENYSPSTPSIRKSHSHRRPNKRSSSVDTNSSSERPRKRRTRSSDVVFQQRVSTLLEQAQSIYEAKPPKTSPQQTESVQKEPEAAMSDMDFILDVDMEAFEKELQEDVLTSDGVQKMEISPQKSPKKLLKKNEMSSDDLWDVTFDDLKVEDLEAMDLSSNSVMLSNAESKKPLVDEDETLFLQGYDELMDIDYDETQPTIQSDPTSIRFKVISVEETAYVTNSFTRPQKSLQIQEDKTRIQCTVHLCDDWINTPVFANDIVNIIGTFDKGLCTVDNTSGIIILHPDNLVSSTHVADSFKCLRRAVLQDQIKASSETTKPLVYGSIIHEAFQEALSKMDFSTKYLEGIIQTLVQRHIEQLYCIDITPADAIVDLREKICLLQAWASVFVAPEPSIFSFMADHCGSTDAKPKVCINKVLDIEEHVWSPTYGLKGNIDATVQVKIEQPDEPTRTLIVPLEVKTGKNTSLMNHRAQTMLYTLMMSDRYDVDVQCGMLYYVDAKESIRVRALRNEIRGLIMGRNELAKWLKTRNGLPEMIRSERDCQNCYAADSCFVYHKALENGNAESSGLESLFDEQTGHLDDKDAEFLRHWNNLLNKEEEDVFRFRNELWTMLSLDREKLGRCFGNLVIDPSETSVDKDGEKINRFRYRFIRAQTITPSRHSFLNSQISIGDPIVVSDELGHFALANGFVTDLQPDVLYVNVDRRLHGARTRLPGFDISNNQTFTGIAEIMEDGLPRISSQLGTQINTTITYRIDKDEFKSGMAMARNNIIQLLTRAGDRKRRELVVRGREPMFKSPDVGTQYSFQEQGDELNIDQRKAVEKVLTAEDYALVLGMPGTGKTTTIAHIIRALVGKGKSVLLTSYTHTAVDNILLKLKSDGIKMLRLGSIAKVHPEVREFAVGGKIQAKTFEELHEKYTSPLVVATTCLGINHFIFNKRKFDYCIVDEASQITLPVCLGPLRYAERFVLVGDHYQLPPLVRNSEAQKGGLDVSLFKLLSELHPQSLTILEHQYRMNEDIMLLSNSLVYDGMLKCGNEDVAKRVLHIPDRRPLAVAKPWIRDVLSDRYKVVFCDTDLLPAFEKKQGDRTTNEVEADLIKQTVNMLRKCGVPPSEIGVMSVYRSQLKVLSHVLAEHPGVEIHTADRFQGRDKEVVIISLVRSNPEKYVGDLLQDWRRVNVAFTRAKSKLVIFGSRSTIRETNPLDEFVKLVEAKQWVYRIPQETAVRRSPRKTIAGKENISPLAKTKGSGGGKIMKITGETVVKGRPVLRDIVNEHR